MSTIDMWTYTTSPAAGIDLTGYSVEARDGGIGKVDDATYDAGSSFVVVDTGPWIFGKKVMLPAGVIQSVDADTETVFVALTKDEIKDSPEYDESRRDDTAFREDLGSYYGSRRVSGDRDVLWGTLSGARAPARAPASSARYAPFEGRARRRFER